MTTTDPRKRAGDRHGPRPAPIPFRVPADDRDWLLGHAETTGRAVNAVLTQALREYREKAGDKTPAQVEP